MTRKEARDAVFKMLFGYEMQKEPADYFLELFFDGNLAAEEHRDYIEQTLRMTIAQSGEIDALIVKYAKGWQISRISKVSLAALRLAICEMKYREDIPRKVAVNEAVELVKLYEGSKAVPFVNGILASVMRELPLEASAEAGGE